ncbi:L-threonylcarbamoyladenylate synthase [Williamwhitmania taraxaci]|uniref:L-threonylcarbamoyladenylate synthase n=1 Tax=Williamwhitmania taraxaci TaxID=1640674 RepID=A0A1G6KR83_9BACT|nr:L-threonylcarbamoyladenylate synthase [Williamwhitmania taraxaci]SDC33321.1 L-threonylcarbamoyladenylate synthase [Williamwhitmania taraxaci]
MEQRANLDQYITEALKVLRAGGIILYPTDTVWGIGCDAENAEAVKKIYDLKKREDSKGMIILVDKADRINSYVNEVPEIAWSLIDITDTPLTIIYSGARNLPTNLLPPENSVGIRVVNHQFCEQLIRKLNRPLVSTSANTTEKPSPIQFHNISQEIIDGVDYVVPMEAEGEPTGKPSAIIMLGVGGQVKIVRE